MYIALFVAFILICWLTTCFVFTKNKTTSILETFGKFSGLRQPGLSFKWPAPIQKVIRRIPLNVRQLHTELELKTRDNLFIAYPITVQYKVVDPRAATYELDNPEEQILSYIGNMVRAEVGKKSFMELYSVRDEIQNVIEQELGEQVDAFGFKIVAVLMDEPVPSKEVQDSYNSVTSSERQREAAKNLAEAKRITIIAEAEAQKEAKKLQGEGIAEQRTAIAAGFKEAMNSITHESGVSNELAIAMMLQLNKFDTIRDASDNPSTLILTDGSSGGQIDELATMLAAVKATKERD